MALKPDIFVCNPQVSSNRGKAVFVHFEVMNPTTFEATGKSHTIAIPHEDALRLFGIFEVMSKEYGWSEAAPPDVVPLKNPPPGP